MIFTRYLCVAAVAVQSLAMSLDELKKLITRIIPPATDLGSYLSKHGAPFQKIPSEQSEQCLSPILYGVYPAFGEPLDENVPPAQAARDASKRLADAIITLDLALIEGCVDNRKAVEDVAIWIAKYTMKKLCDLVAPTDEMKRKLTACLPDH